MIGDCKSQILGLLASIVKPTLIGCSDFIYDAANYLKFHKPELGIKHPYALNKAHLDAALNLLREKR